jgi:hypothetical protein
LHKDATIKEQVTQIGGFGMFVGGVFLLPAAPLLIQQSVFWGTQNPVGLYNLGGIAWGSLSDENAPGPADDLSRSVRQSVAKILENATASSMKIEGAGAKIFNILEKTGDRRLKESFENGGYAILEASEDFTVYRVSGGSSTAKGGSFFSTTKPKNSEEAEKLLNIEVWGNKADAVTPVTIKKGTQFAIGKVAGGEGGQIFIPKIYKNLLEIML